MSGYSRSYVRVGNPYCLLACSVFEEVFRTITCYFTGIGTEEEIADGKRNIKWIMKMEGSFKTLSVGPLVTLNWTLDKWHQLCILKINELKEAAYEQQSIQRESEKGIQSGEGDMPMGLEEPRPDSQTA